MPPIPFMPQLDFVYFATGMQSGIHGVPFLQDFNRKWPIDVRQGFPVLTDDLMWKSNLPLFVTGRLASLRLGPGAGNLEGARLGAERISLAVEEVLGGSHDRKPMHPSEEEDAATHRYACGIGSRFEALEVD